MNSANAAPDIATETLGDAAEVLADVQPKRLPGYPAYRDSGVRWLGDIPEHWRVRKLKFIADVRTSNVDKKTVEGQEPVHLCNYVDVYYNDYITSDIEFMAASATRDQIKRFKIEPGDVIITKDSEAWDDIAVPTLVDQEFDDVLCGYHLALIRPDAREAIGDYLFRAFAANAVLDQFRVRANGITRFGLSRDGVTSGLFPLPPLDEQRAIAGFLRWETARIDGLVEKKRRLINLLREKRTALISDAVTKGLNPDAPMKPSGIDWLGDVPKHWTVTKLKFSVGKIGSGKTPKGGAEVYVSSGVMLLRSQNVHDDGLRLNDVVFIDEDTDAEMAGTRVRPLDVLLNITGASIGRCGLVPKDMPPANVNQHVCIIRPTKVNPAFLHAVLCSKGIKDWIAAEENGTSREGLNFRQVGGIALPLPDETEQAGIVAEVNRQADRIDALIRRVEEVIERLNEHRAALISAAVTGKIDVRGEVSGE